MAILSNTRQSGTERRAQSTVKRAAQPKKCRRTWLFARFGGGSSVFVHVFFEITQEEHAHAQHENNARNAHQAVIGGKKVGNGFQVDLLRGF